jgi:hypothetical protein
VSLFRIAFLPLPLTDGEDLAFDPVLLDDMRALLLMRLAGRRRRADWMALRLVLRYPPEEVGRLVRTMCDTPHGT